MLAAEQQLGEVRGPTLENLAISHHLLDVVLRLGKEVKYVDNPALHQLGQLAILFLIQDLV